MNQHHNPLSLIKETAVLTIAVAIIAAAVYFFLSQAMRLSAVFPDLALYFPTSSRSRFPRSR